MNRSGGQILEDLYQNVLAHPNQPFLRDQEAVESISKVCNYLNNRAPVRFLMACCLAKVDHPSIDIRAPYTEIQDEAYSLKKYSGRTYDEGPIEKFVLAYNLPVNATTAFLTPAFRTKHFPLLPGTDLGGRRWEKIYYDSVLWLIDAIEDDKLAPEDVLAETIRNLLLLREQNVARMLSILDEMRTGKFTALSSEDIVALIEQHLASPKAARLPVLVVAAAYQAASDKLGERVLPLESHHAADLQTGALGDLEITLIRDDQVITSYEMKMKQVTKEDIDRAVRKIGNSSNRVDNYLFITTDVIDEKVREYAKSLYRITGTEFAILNCIDFLDAYQQLLLAEPNSAVRPALKESFLALRLAAESSYDENS